MRNNISVGMAIFGLFVSGTAHADATYTTSKGAVFTQVDYGKFGKSWKDPGGTIWSANQGFFENNPIKPDQDGIVVDSPATEACTKITGSLPTVGQYQKLVSYFESDEYGNLSDRGLKDLYAVFPDMQGYMYWSSTVVPASPEIAYTFSGLTGEINDFTGIRCGEECGYMVLCVAR